MLRSQQRSQQRSPVCFACLPIGSFCAVGTLLLITGAACFAVANYVGQYTDTNPQLLVAAKQASYTLLASGGVFIGFMLFFILCVQFASRRRVSKTSQQWEYRTLHSTTDRTTTVENLRDTMLRMIEEVNAANPPPPRPSLMTTRRETTPPPSYESSRVQMAPPPYEIAVGQQLAGVHLPDSRQLMATRSATTLHHCQVLLEP